MFDLERLHNIFPDTPWALSVQFSPDDVFLAVGYNRGVQIFRADTGQLVHDLRHDSPSDSGSNLVRVIRFSTDGRTLAAGGGDGKILIWDIESSRVLHTFVDTGSPIRCMDISKDSGLLIAGSEDHIKFVAVDARDGVMLLDFPDCRLVGEIGDDDAHDDSVQSVAFSPSGRGLASASFDKTVKIWDISPTGQASFKRTFEGHEDMVICLCWSSDGCWIISGSKDRIFQVWDVESGCAHADDFAFGHIQDVIPPRYQPLESRPTIDPCSSRIASGVLDMAVTEKRFLQGTNSALLSGLWMCVISDAHLRDNGLPINFLPSAKKRFPILMGNEDRDWTAATLHVREVCMLKMLDELTDKPEWWWRKARDPEIVARWKGEAMAIDWASYRRHGDFTGAMADAQKADLYEKTGLIPVCDYSACAIKSDTVAAAFQGKVLDLVHPSLWPLIYGRTRVITTGSIDIQTCLDFCGQGKAISKPTPANAITKKDWPRFGNIANFPSLSLNFQWLPCDVAIDKDGGAMIHSYINNLHPGDRSELYKLIGEFIQESLPAWDIIYRWPKEFPFQRLRTDTVGPHCTVPDICSGGDVDSWYECDPTNRPLNEGEPNRGDDEAYDEGYDESSRGKLDKEWFDITRVGN
ncbi:WD40-repeat-containing domain protein [Xylaria digitata]|nr:WD40-repeat-containing domain protein [Xylaria digitata]